MTAVATSGGADPRRVATALAVLGDRGKPGAPLGALTTYRVGGPAAIRVDASEVGDLEAVAAAVSASGLPVLAVGRGSNLLVADAGFGGIAVTLDPTSEAFGATRIGRPGDDQLTPVRAGAAVALPTLARRTADAGLTGLEWAVGVPGSVGGGVRMNAGGHGSDVASCLRRAWIVDTTAPFQAPTEVSVSAMAYGYRKSSVAAEQLVVAAEFALGPGERERSVRTIRDIVRWRREHQPGGQNAGSVFTNPPGGPPANSAGWVIEAAGLKGRRLRSAMVSDKHANFIQADPGGTADDVLALIELVRAEVERRMGVVLRPEVRLIGFDNPEVSSCAGGL